MSISEEKNQLYDLAFSVRAAKPWKVICEEEIFAVQLTRSLIGYVSVMGRNGEHLSVALYVGPAGFRSLMRLMDAETSTPAAFHIGISQESLQCVFESRDELDPAALAEVRDYAKREGYVFKGPNSYPSLMKYESYALPSPIRRAKDIRYLSLALEATLALLEALGEHDREDLGLAPLENAQQALPLLTKEGDMFRVSSTPQPRSGRVTPPQPKAVSPARIRELRALRRIPELCCEVFRAPAPIQDDPDEPPYFPALLMIMDRKSHMLYRPAHALGRIYNADELLSTFIDSLMSAEICPKTISVRDEETRCLLEGFCRDAKIRLAFTDELPELDDALSDLLDFFARGEAEGDWALDDDDDDDDDWDEEDEALFNFDETPPEATLDNIRVSLMTMSEKELRGIPPFLIRQYQQLIESGDLPKSLAVRLEKLPGWEK